MRTIYKTHVTPVALCKFSCLTKKPEYISGHIDVKNFPNEKQQANISVLAFCYIGILGAVKMIQDHG